MLTETTRNPRANREKTIQLMFDTFEVNKCYIAKRPVLSLYTQGRSTGLVVESGNSVTESVPVVEGYHLAEAFQRMDIAGQDLHVWLQKILLTHCGESF